MKATQFLPTSGCAVEPRPYQTSPPDRILVVDDDETIRRLNTETLIHAGYEVDAAEDGAAAWQALNSASYDLLVTDNKMPKVTGVELLKQLRATRIALPVIMATGTVPEVEFNRHPWLQPNATLVKPYTTAELVSAVKRVLREAISPSDACPSTEQRDLKSSGVSPATMPRQGPTNSPARILVVDDDRDLRRLYVETLVGAGYSVDIAGNGAGGWEALRTKSYHLLITEHDLPILTGVELVRKLRAARMALPVVMAVARLPAFELARNPSLQLAATLVKPFSMEALLATLKTLLNTPSSSPTPTAPQHWRQRQPAAVG